MRWKLRKLRKQGKCWGRVSCTNKTWSPPPPASTTTWSTNTTPTTHIPEISEKHFSTLETRTRISRIQSRTSRREREFLSHNLMLRDKTENNFLQSQASRRDRDLFFLISDYETRTRLGPREKINLILTRIFEIDNYRYALLWFFTGVVSMR